MPLVPRCAERETAGTIIDQQLSQLMREPWAAGPAFHRRVDRFHFLVAQNEGLTAGRSEKACDLKA